MSLSLRDPNDVLRLQRDLPVQGGSCATLSRVIALVLERFFLRPEQATPVDVPPTAEAEKELAPEPSVSSEVTAPRRSEPALPPAALGQRQADVTPPAPLADQHRYRLRAGLWMRILVRRLLETS